MLINCKIVFSICIATLVISSCSFEMGGFKPPKQHFSWYLHNFNNLYPKSEPNSFFKYVERMEKDMRSCGIDPVLGESDRAKDALCMESKGWYLESGPACEDQILKDQPLCVKWRKEHGYKD
ncbi:hypothetical protein [Lonepinella sp. BR2357]|uniref:hypothetical protein n=1 Tax=Lonepinella sp. BR2357 TaxID=3434549 RepID=UPI003F6DFE61